jgi:hypothetical protein
METTTSPAMQELIETSLEGVTWAYMETTTQTEMQALIEASLEDVLQAYV